MEHQVKVRVISSHAKRRVVKRSKVNPAPFLGMLQAGAYVMIERKTGSLRKNIAYLLFYSIPKSQWFVAVINKTSKKIVTVHAMNNGIRWSVTDEYKEEARSRALRHRQSLREPRPAAPQQRVKTDPKSTSDDFRFYARIAGQQRLLLTIPRHEGRSLREARRSPGIRTQLGIVAQQKIRPNETVDKLFIKDMHSGEEELVPEFLVRLK